MIGAFDPVAAAGLSSVVRRVKKVEKAALGVKLAFGICAR
jgi:hypothetical protein